MSNPFELNMTPEPVRQYILPRVRKVVVVDGDGIRHVSEDPGEVNVFLYGETLEVRHTASTARHYRGRP